MTSVVVTGAGGYLASFVVRELLADPRLIDAAFVLTDTVETAERAVDPRVRFAVGDLTDGPFVEGLLASAPDVVIHLAGVLGGAAEADYDLARRVNVDATLRLFEGLRRPGRPPRVVYASSIAVFGPPLPDPCVDDSPPHPVLVYGAQKLQMEAVLEQFSARGWLDGVALRLPGIVARRGADARLRSAFLNRVFYAHEEGADVELPVSEAGASWLLSARQAARSVAHAALLPAGSFGRRRAFVIPAQRVVMRDLVSALGARRPGSPARISYAPDPETEAQFASYPELRTDIADALGFADDGSLEALIDAAPG